MAKEPIPRGYPSPQVEVDSGRGVGPAVPRQAAQVSPGALIPEAQFTEVREADAGRGGGFRAVAIWLLREAVLPALYKTIPQGAQEIANGLFTENPYWPGGETQQPVPIAEDSAPLIGPPASVEAENYPQVTAYEESLSMYAARGNDGQSQERTR